MLTLKDLEMECYKYNITEFLKSVSNEELERLLDLVLCDDLVETRLKIYEALLIEIEYRKNDALKNSNTNEEKVLAKRK